MTAPAPHNSFSLNVGDKAPDFKNIAIEGGKRVNLSDFKGKNIVLYFYPKDDTPGCTTEAKDFTALKSELEKLNTVIFGVSKDSVKAHDKFIEKHCLSISLLSDEDGTLCESYGTWVEKSMYGRKYMGIARATFLIDSKGIIRHIWPKVSVKNHAQEVLKAVKAL